MTEPYWFSDPTRGLNSAWPNSEPARTFADTILRVVSGQTEEQ